MDKGLHGAHVPPATDTLQKTPQPQEPQMARPESASILTPGKTASAGWAWLEQRGEWED